MYNKSYPKISGIYIMQENMKLILDLKKTKHYLTYQYLKNVIHFEKSSFYAAF